MEFETVLLTLLRFFEERSIRHAVIGGMALQAWGYSRFTRDLDLVVEADAQDSIVAFTTSRGYETLHRSEGYSNHLHPDPALGRIDFMYVDAATADPLFAGAIALPVIGAVLAPVPRPEHLAAMKALAMKNSPARVLTDSADVQFLMGLPGVHRSQIREYFERYGLLEIFDAIEKRS